MRPLRGRLATKTGTPPAHRSLKKSPDRDRDRERELVPNYSAGMSLLQKNYQSANAICTNKSPAFCGAKSLRPRCRADEGKFAQLDTQSMLTPRSLSAVVGGHRLQRALPPAQSAGNNYRKILRRSENKRPTLRVDSAHATMPSAAPVTPHKCATKKDPGLTRAGVGADQWSGYDRTGDSPTISRAIISSASYFERW